MNDKFNLPKHNFTEDQIAEMMSPALAQKREQERKHKQFIIDALCGNLEDNSGPYTLRTIVERDNWFVPLQDDGRFVILNVKRDQYARLIAGIWKKDGRRTDRQGRGGQFIPVYAKTPDGDFAAFDGRALARVLPDGPWGLLIEGEPGKPLCELDHEYIPTLRALADAVEIESIFLSRTAIPTQRILDYRFRVAMHEGLVSNNDNVASIATFQDTEVFSDDSKVAEMTAREIFQTVLRDDRFSGIVLNPHCGIEINGVHARNANLSLNFLHRALSSDTAELRVVERVARSREEFALWLDINFFPTQREIIETKDADGKTCLHAIAQSSGNASTYWEWEIVEKDGTALTDQFELRPTPGASDEFAQGPSRILCPGLLARHLYAELPEQCRRENIWKPGRWFGAGRFLSEQDIAVSKARIILANELLKLIPENSPRIPREKLLTVEGATFLQWATFAADRQWAIDARDQARRYSTRWVFGA